MAIGTGWFTPEVILIVNCASAGVMEPAASSAASAMLRSGAYGFECFILQGSPAELGANTKFSSWVYSAGSGGGGSGEAR